MFAGGLLPNELATGATRLRLKSAMSLIKIYDFRLKLQCTRTDVRTKLKEKFK